MSAKGVRFYIQDTKKFLQCIQLFRSETSILLTLSTTLKSITMFNLIQSNIAVLQIILYQDNGTLFFVDDVALATPCEDVVLQLDTKTFIKALTEMLRFESVYCVLQPSTNQEQLVCTAMDKNNREVVCHRIHCISPTSEISDSSMLIERPNSTDTASVVLQKSGKLLCEYFATGEDTTISTEPALQRVVWSVNDTLLNTRRFLYINEKDTLSKRAVPLKQTYIKSIMGLIRNILQFLNMSPCGITCCNELPIHIFNTKTASMRVDFLAGSKVDENMVDMI